MTVGRFVTAGNEVSVGGFLMDHAKGELKTRRDHEILRFLSPCWEKKYLKEVLYALYLVYSRYLFNMGPAYMFSRGVGTLRSDGFLTLVLLAHGELTAFHRLMNHGEPLSVKKAHPSKETYSHKCAAGLKTLLVEYLLMQNRYLTGEERNPKTREELREANGGIPLLTYL